MRTSFFGKALAIVVSIGFALGVAACGGDDKSDDNSEPTSGSIDNVAACKRWVASISCGQFDPATVVSCDTYSNVTTCDISDYFDCLSDNFKCTSGMPDTTGWASCMSKATCSPSNSVTGGGGGGGSSSSFDNVAACKKWVESIVCGPFDPTTFVQCDTYGSMTTCDISGYFDCLSDNFKCTNDMPDVSGWTACQAKATCN